MEKKLYEDFSVETKKTRTVGFLEKIHRRVPVAPRGTRPLELSVADASAGVTLTPALTSANSGFSPGKTCPWASLGSWDPPPNWATGPALELSRAASGSLSPGLPPALEMLRNQPAEHVCTNP
ncbi:unnamed protein product [Prunus armeniaca]